VNDIEIEPLPVSTYCVFSALPFMNHVRNLSSSAQRFAVHRRSPERQVDTTPAPEFPVSLCVLRRCSRASSGATAGWTTGPPYQASRVAEAKLHPRHSGITAGELDEFVEGP